MSSSTGGVFNSDLFHPSVEQSAAPSQAHLSLFLLTQAAGKRDTVDNPKSISTAGDLKLWILIVAALAFKLSVTRWSKNNRRSGDDEAVETNLGHEIYFPVEEMLKFMIKSNH